MKSYFLTVLAIILAGTITVKAQNTNISEIPVEENNCPEAILEGEADSLAFESQMVLDSLLAEWYKARALKDNELCELEILDSVRYSSHVPDSILVKRIGRINSFITLPFNETVKNYIVLYSEKMNGKMERIISLSDYYFPIFEETLDRYGMPLELKYMSIIESALNPTARSRAGARGVWQFMYTTGKRYGLEISSFVDERMDVEKAADAAARYLMDAYNVFGDWCLAISSYNCGPGNVLKAIKRSGGHKDFWSIYPFLPRETRGYMPAFVGAMYAMNYYKEYGIKPSESPLPIQCDTFKITKNLHFRQIDEILGIPIELVREINPQYTHDIIPGSEEKPYILKLPYSATSLFINNQDTLFLHKADTLLSEKVIKSIKNGGDGEAVRYKVKSGDYLGRIASRYHVSVTQLKQWNGLRSNNIRVGQTLLIYSGRGPVPAQPAASTTSKPSGPAPAESASPDSYVIYTVKSGDSLFSISQNYPGISANDLMRFNGISSSIKPGQKIKIPKK